MESVKMESVKKRKKKQEEKEVEKIVPEGSYEYPGVEKITVSVKSQKALEIECGKHVNIEREWKLVNRQTLMDYVDANRETSEFLPIIQKIQEYPGEEILFVYIPMDGNENEDFYVCTTPKCRESVEIAIQYNKRKVESKLKESIYKTPRVWENLGSDIEVDELLEEIQSRPLFQIEVDAKLQPCEQLPKFHERNVEDVIDGYTELTDCGRVKYDLVYMKRVDASAQAAPERILIEAQTEPRYPMNVWTQYEYDPTPPKEVKRKEDAEKIPNVNEFLNEARASNMQHEIVYNGDVELYNNEFRDLKKHKTISCPEHVHFEEITSFSNTAYKEKLITCAAWHPMWTGICAVAYASSAPSTERHKFQHMPDEVLRAVHEPNLVYVWSTSDDLNPKLILDCKREVLTLKFCPHDANILVGGCANGQIVVWDIKNKLAKVEHDEFLTLAQKTHRKYISSLMYWFKNVKNEALVPETIMSSLLHSHTDSVRGIDWIHPRLSVNRCGRVSKILGDGETSLQFMTCAQDSLILIWDLKYYPPLGKTEAAKLKTKQIVTRRPSILMSDISELRELNSIFRPVFKIVVSRLDKRPLPLMNICLFNDNIQYKPNGLIESTKHSLYQRVIYDPIITDPSEGKNYQTVAGLSLEGDFFIAKWEGIDVDSGLPVNREACTFRMFHKSHIGIGLTISKSPFFPDILLTVGGRSICLWQEDFLSKPLCRKKGKKKYTMGVWSPYKKWSFLVSREDGTVEIWDLTNQTYAPTYEINFSGKPLTGFYIHEINVINNGIGIADESPHFRIFYIPKFLTKQYPESEQNSDMFVNRSKLRKETFQEWEKDWFAEHEEELKRARKEQEEELLRREQEMEQERVRSENEKLKREELAMKYKQISEKPQPGQFSEWAHNKWMAKQQERVYQLLIAKKKLNQKVLISQQEPLKCYFDQERIKKEKLREMMDNKDQISDNVTNKIISMISQQYTGQRPKDVQFNVGERDALKRVFIEQYDEMKSSVLECVEKHPHEYKFDWISFENEATKRFKKMNSEFVKPPRAYKRPRNTTLFDRMSLKKSLNGLDAAFKSSKETLM